LFPRYCPLGIAGAVVAAAALPREAHELKLVIELLREPLEGKLGERQV
jgi:fructose-specific phosphotransferase system component IIB